jgi:hypothetical protein
VATLKDIVTECTYLRYLLFQKIVYETMVKVISHVIPEGQLMSFRLIHFAAPSVEQLPRCISSKITDSLIFMQYLD